MTKEEKMKIVINNYFKTECSVNTSIREAFEKGFRIGASKVQTKRKEGEWIYGEDSSGQDGWFCSECRFFVPWYYVYNKNIDFIRAYKTCPCCDAKMISYTGKNKES